MAESSKVRLVRCPKCENLLPELPDYSVYQCGGCGAVLRAKKGNPEGVNGSQRSDEERDRVASGKEAVSGVENAEEIRVSDSERNTETVAQKLGSESKREVVKWAIEDGNSSKTELGNLNLESKGESLETHVENASGSRRSSRVFERKLSDRGEEERFGRIRRGFLEGGRCSSSNLVGEGTSKFHLDSNYRNGGATRAEYVNPDREDLLRKLDELKEQLSRVQNGGVNSREKVPLERKISSAEPYVETDDYYRDHPSRFHQVSRQFSAPNKHATGASYFEPYPVINRPNMASHNYPNLMPSSNHVPSYRDPFEAPLYRRPPRRVQSHLHHVTPEPDPYDPHLYNTAMNPLSCSCCQCYEQQPHVPPQIPPTFGNRRFPHVGKEGPCHHHEMHSGFGHHGYNSRMFNAHMGSCNPQPHSRWPSELNLEMGSLHRARPPQRVILGNGRRCYPVAGGAPFVTCQNCFELLRLPKKVVGKKGEWKMSCGACSSVISFAIVDEKLVSTDDPSGKQTAMEALDSSNEVGHHGHLRRDNASFCSEDYANSVYDFQAMDREPVSSSTGQGVSSSKSEEMHNLHSVSATTSEDGHFSDDLIATQGSILTAEPPEKANTSPPGSPLQDPFDYTSKYRAVNRCGKGNLSSRSDQDRVMNKSTMRQNSLKESLATEMEISLKDYANNGISQDAGDAYREDQPKGKKGVDAFLAGIIKKSFRDFSKSSHTMHSGKRNVTVNGHLIPDRLVKKAEKLAGPVYPGQYWYDYRAGFWGVMGGPCLGIIPPCIEEFNYPMPEKCAAGNTGVYVNGRELHQKDLDLLVTRGLPAARNRSYIIDILGRVVDENSGLELDCLGKLAPTVEKVKHGFGMRVPKAAA